MNQPNSSTTSLNSGLKPKCAIAHLGSRWSYDVPVILHRMGMLTRFYTDAYCGTGSWLAALRLLPPPLTMLPALRRLQSRARPEISSDQITAFNLLGIEFNIRYGRAKTQNDLLQLFMEINQRFNQRILAEGLPAETNILFSMNTASLELFEHLQNTSIKRLMDQTLLPMQVESSVLEKEYERWADWPIDKFQDWRNTSIFQRWIERERREWELADQILCASPNTAKALQSCGVPAHKCQVIPYTVNYQMYAIERNTKRSTPLRILFVGQVNLRKGIPYFLQMLQQLPSGSFEARVVGPIQLNPQILARYSDLCTFTDAVPRNQMPSHYAWADVFVFPSLCDSAPGASNEALAAGLPIITTHGAGTIVEDGVNGWVVADRDVEALVARVEQLSRDRELLTHMSYNAVKSVKKISLEAYGEQFRQVCESMLATSADDRPVVY